MFLSRHAFALAVLVAAQAASAAAEAAPELAAEMLPTVEVVGKPDGMKDVAGGASLVHRHELEATRPLSTSEALRKLPGLHARDEEGLGLRPNVSVRGLNPTRSTKITLLEDGVPISYAPYGDNASYYHPPIERFASIELLTGTEQLRFGPQTIGGTINYLTPAPRQAFGGFVSGTVGERALGMGQLQLGGNGMLLDFSRKQADGARDNMHSQLEDFSVKKVVELTVRQALTLRANIYTEDSQLTYSGLTLAELQNFGPRYNPFKNDEFEAIRRGGSITHRFEFDRGALVTSAYGAGFDRNWWRQSSTTTDTQCGTGFRDDRLAGVTVDPDACASAQGRLRRYDHWGIEPRLTLENSLGEFLASAKVHRERQDRLQVNATTPTGRSGTVVEDNLRLTEAIALFIAQRFVWDEWSVLAALRNERIDSTRINRLTATTGRDSLSATIPGLGVNWTPRQGLTLFAAAHRGFAPPRTEDIISGAGTSTDVGAERSTNLEAGVRWREDADLELQAALFRNDFDRLIAVGSIAGGNTPLAEGEALFAGLELAGAWRFANAWTLRANHTWTPTAEQSTAFTQVVGGAPVAGSAAGLRQPYTPEQLLTASLAWARADWSAALELQHIGAQYADFANTEAVSADGQRGRIDAATVLSLTVDHAFGTDKRASVFAAVKNLTDEVYVVDRTRGIQVGMPRLVEVGVRYEF